MLVMGLSASTAVALADDGRQGDPSRSAPTTLVDAMVTTTAAQKPPTTQPAPTTVAPDTDSTTTTEASN